ncbi:hypothetical protein EZ449_15260 [Pedobacter frigidisoli]|uniref:Fibronectin type-III domain-containing protein n=1 Tax=Pedobacter frigidisoli TaxID=2530455 RepID=A0A4R0P2C2_9SPHI|nr:hypothetical protein [Pedobacter frigidisoli]TCD07146.1 hypothetical protein EZ449_15260 [Pedobacter frigidisoli]
MKKVIYIILLVFPVLAWSQAKEGKAAFIGYNGIYIYNLFKPASVQHPDGDVIGFKLDRKSSRETAWTTIQKFSSPSNYDELVKGYEKAKTKVFEYRQESAYGIDEVWPIYKKTFTYDSLSIYVTQQALAVAFNLLLVDTTANVADTYQYRVVQVKRDQTNGALYTSTPVSYAYKFPANKPKAKLRSLLGGINRLVFVAKATAEEPEGLLIKRKTEDGKFERVMPFYTIEKIKDSITYMVSDEDVSSEKLYQYTVTPVNRYGGGANSVSDTISANAIDQKLLIPKGLTAKADSLNNSITLNWGFLKPDYVSTVMIYRSEAYEDGYTYLSSSQTGVYVDKSVIPGKKYYYYLTITDKFGRPSERSTKVFGLVQNLSKPIAPQYVKVASSTGGNVLTWEDYSPATRGYRVYRTDQIEGKLVPASDFIYVDSKLEGKYSYTDTSSLIKAKGYAVRLENLSNVQSEFSKVVYVADKDKTILTPAIQDASTDQKYVYLFWKQPTSSTGVPSGYNLYRKIDDGKYEKLNKKMINGTKTSYRDSIVNMAAEIYYKLTAVNTNNVESEFSEEFQAKKSSQEVYPPSFLKSFVTNDKNSVALQWQPSQSKIKNYSIYRYARGEEPTVIAEVAGTTRSFIDKKYNKDKTNYYYIVANNDKGITSIKSNEAFVILNK